MTRGTSPPKESRVTRTQAWDDFKVWCDEQDIPAKFRPQLSTFAKEIAKNGGSSSGEVEKLGSCGLGFDRLYWLDWESGYTGEKMWSGAHD